jgi:Tfp pilus assembly major pilin PilA
MKQNQKGFGLIELFLITVVVIALGFVSIIIYQRYNKKHTGQKISKINAVCAIIDDATFSSVEALGGGFSPKDHSHWILKFTNGNVRWVYGDQVESGQYTCTNNKIGIQLNNSQKSATFDPSTQSLIFEGYSYKVEAE